ncbi:MAG: prepilin-type N-terminal cleavage/methylation domain-containing protein [Desulfobacterales bacterium]
MLHTKLYRMHKNEDGFTLLEIMISTVILSVGLLAIGIMQISSIDGDAKAREITEAGTLAMDQLETLLAKDYTSISTGADQQVYNDGKYTVTVTVTENTEDTENVAGLGVDVKMVVMTVAWQSKYEDGVKNKTFSMRHVIPMIDK